MTKADFDRVPVLRREISRELALWENALEGATNISYVLTGMPHGSGVSSKVENAIIKADEHHIRYSALCDELRDIWARLKKDIVRCKLSEDEANVVDSFYPKAKRVSEIAKDIGVTERHVWRVKKNALRKLCDGR